MKYLFLFLLLPLFSHANDGAFRAQGNQLIPVYETDISVKKEVLTIRRVNETSAQIEVYYEFFNPRADKTIEVGFEAVSPSGDVTVYPKDGHQPYITHFSVNVNDMPIPYKVAIVHDKSYYRNGEYKAISLAKAKNEAEEGEYVDFFYVYHFRATFKQGLNIVRHKYTVDLSSSVMEKYSLDYVLTAAKRWANRQIDDFTLQIDMGEFQDVSIEQTFFKHAADWKTDSTVKSVDVKAADKDHSAMSEFFIRKGTIVFAQKNFKPGGELSIRSFNEYYYKSAELSLQPDAGYPEKFDSKKDGLPFSIDSQDGILPPADELSRKILHNLPFARRGYIFKSPEIAAYYKKQPWYMPDPAYTPVADELTKKEQEWLAKNR